MSTPPSSLPPANWYPDPQTPGQLRYWDGQRWTAHVHQVQQQQPPQAAGGFGTQEPQAANPFAQAIQLSQGNPYTPTTQAIPNVGTVQPAAAGPATGQFSPGPAAAGSFAPGAQAAGPATGQFSPTAAPGGFAPGAQAAGPATGQFSPTAAAGGLAPGPQAAGPATGGLFVPGAQPARAGSFSPTPPTTGSIPISTSRTRDFDEEEVDHGDGASTAPLTGVAAILGVAAIGVTALSIFGLGTDFDQYFPYVGAGLGFFAILFGFLGRRSASSGLMGGAAFAWAGIGGGFLAIMLSVYEIMYPGELYDIFSDYL